VAAQKHLKLAPFGSVPNFFTTIADFVCSLNIEITHLCRDVLMICDERGLIGKVMFAIDGCNLPGNAAEKWSGAKADYEKKAVKMEVAVEP
jgi:hypothetical protein